MIARVTLLPDNYLRAVVTAATLILMQPQKCQPESPLHQAPSTNSWNMFEIMCEQGEKLEDNTCKKMSRFS